MSSFTFLKRLVRFALPIALLVIIFLISCAVIGPRIYNTEGQDDESYADPLQVDQVLKARHGARVGQITIKYGTGARMKSAGIDQDPEELYQRSLSLMERYADKWGYPFWIGRHELLEGPQGDGRTGMWSKQALVLSIMLDELRKPEGTRLEWLL